MAMTPGVEAGRFSKNSQGTRGAVRRYIWSAGSYVRYT